MATNAVLFHHPDSVDTSRTNLMGRHAAGEGFLQGFVRHSGVDAFYAQTMTDEHFTDFTTRVSALDTKARPCHRLPLGTPIDPPEARTLMIPGPTLSSFAWRRRGTGSRAYSLCGVNHTIASEAIMDGLGALLTTPVQEWDAVICTSQAVKATVLRLLGNWADFLNTRAGGHAKSVVQLPVIPLGVDCEAYGTQASGGRERVRLRRGLGIRDDDIAVLFMGRLSFHAKAHPMPMYLALEEAARQTKKRIHLIQAGWFATKSIEKQFRDGARMFCPSVRAIFLDGREDDVRFRIWAAADIFTSLSDNIQETFGLTPIEAMASGLPSVVTDWNGYRDTVRDGVDGFAVPTWMAPEGAGADLSIPFEELGDRDQIYNRYCGVISQCTAVDVRRCVEAFVALIGNAELRSEMGAKARARALERFDWRVVVGAYQELWRELGRIRERGREIGPKGSNDVVHPLRDDPFALFAAYPTAVIGHESSVALIPGVDAARVRALKQFPMNEFASKTFLDDPEIEAIVARLRDIGTMAVADLKDCVPPPRRHLVERTLAWLAKMNIVRLSRAAERSPPKPKRREAEVPAVAPAAPVPAPEPPAPAEPPPVAADVAEESKPRGFADQLADAVRDRRRISGAQDIDVESLKERAAQARQEGNLSQAAKHLQQALAANPDDAATNNSAGEILAIAGRMDLAVDCFRNALRVAPEFIEAHRNLGKALFLRGDQAEGIHSFRRAVHLAPDDAESRFLLGAALRRGGATHEAVQCLKICIGLEDQRPDPYYHLGLALKALGRRSDAAQAFADAVRLDPENGFFHAAVASLAIDAAGQAKVGASQSAKRVGLFLNQKFHYAILRPLFDALTIDHWPLLSADANELVEFRPNVMIACDAAAREIRPNGGPRRPIVYVREGLASKNRALPLAKAADYSCVASETERDSLIRAGLPAERIWATGHLQTDALFKREGRPAPVSLPSGRRTVLYAPTYEPLLSSAPMLGTRLAELIRGKRDDVTIVIRPHPLACEHQKSWMAAWRQLALSESHIVLAGEAGSDLVPYLKSADVLVSDCSSVAFMYLAVDRPIVLITNPDHARDRASYDPTGIEWRLRGIGEEISDVSVLARAVERAISDPGTGAEQRARYRSIVFGDLTDGRAAERIAEKISALDAGP